MKLLYGADSWLTRAQANEAVQHCLRFRKCYTYLAHLSHLKRQRRFAMIPKLHSIDEIAFEMQVQAQRSQWVLSPLVEACMLDEDMVGRMAFLTRCVSPRMTSLRSLERYLCQLHAVWALEA